MMFVQWGEHQQTQKLDILMKSAIEKHAVKYLDDGVRGTGGTRSTQRNTN